MRPERDPTSRDPPGRPPGLPERRPAVPAGMLDPERLALVEALAAALSPVARRVFLDELTALAGAGPARGVVARALERTLRDAHRRGAAGPGAPSAG